MGEHQEKQERDYRAHDGRRAELRLRRSMSVYTEFSCSGQDTNDDTVASVE